MSVAGTDDPNDRLLEEKQKPDIEIELVDKGYDLLTPANAIIAHTEIILAYANQATGWQEFIPDLKKMLLAGEQLASLITRLFSKENTPTGEIDLEKFSSSIRHDLRTPINAIIGYGEILLEDSAEETQTEARVDLQKILALARRLLTLINDLTYSSPSSETSTAKVAEPTVVAASPTLMDDVVHTMRTTDNSVEIISQEASLLVVDDKESNRELLSRRLDRQGFYVEVAENGRQALEMMYAKDYDLVLLDIIMPEMDGYQVLGQIKADEELCNTPVIMISALDEIESVVRCIEMGAEDYLQKPFNQVILRAKIAASLERKWLRDREHAFIKKLQIEQDKSEKLLLNILPKPIADRLKRGEQTIADNFEDVTVLFADIVNFTGLFTNIAPNILVGQLNEIFLAFDLLTERLHLEKIKTIGDAYMLVGGLPEKRSDHAEMVAEMALNMLTVLEYINEKRKDTFKLKIRIGIHTGPVVAGIIGKNKFNYDLWGDTVNTASRMESQGIPGRIQVSEETYKRLQHDFLFECRGKQEIKGKGEMVTYFLIGRKSQRSSYSI